MGRDHYNTWTRIRAVLESPSLYQIAQGLDWDSPVGRPAANPPYVLLAYGALARLQRSGIRVELDLAEPHIWPAARTLMTEAIARHGLDLPPPGHKPPRWDHWRWVRDHHLCTDDGLGQLARVFPPVAAACASRIGLLRVDGPGSFTHPDRIRAIYGDGTLVRPLYRPPQTVQLANDDGTTTLAYPDPRTGQLHPEPLKRFDPDLQPHHGQLGPVLTHGYAFWHARGPRTYQRVELAIAHIPAPGTEADTAVRLLRDVHHAVGAGAQVVVYDGAFRGVHIEEIMRSYGYIVLARPHTDSTAADIAGTSLLLTSTGRRARSYPLGMVSHALPTGSCTHQIAAVAGGVVEVDLDETGDPVLTQTLTRTSVKRSRRSDGRYYFNVGYHLDCPHQPFTTWLTPHPDKPGDYSRPENLRIIAHSDPDALRLRGIRSDAESAHSNLKRTFIVDRAMSLGWRRVMLDIYSYAIYNNALTEYRAAQEEEARPARRAR